MWVAESDLEAAGTRLFCLPHAGSGAAGFYRWKRMLAGEVAVVPVRLPGRESRMAEPLLRSVGEIVDGLHAEVREELEREYVVFGHSMSALVAFEWVRRIQREGLRMPKALVVSGRRAPQTGSAHTALHQATDEAMLAGLAERYGEQALSVLADEEMRAIYLPVLRADVEVVETYVHAPGEALTCDVVALAGDRDASVSDDGLAAWRDVCAAGFRTVRVPGDHYSPFGEGQSAVLEVLRGVC